jgi:hypothetical protein
VLGVPVITSEYSTGSIQTSLAAVPRRGRFLAAKATVLTAVSLITGEATALTVFLLGQALISGQAPTAAFGQPGVLRAVLGSGLYLAALGLLSVALGTLPRHPAAAIGVLVAVVLVLPGIAVTGRGSWNREVVVTWRFGPRGTRWLEPNGHASCNLRLIAILAGTSSGWATLPVNARRRSAGTWRRPEPELASVRYVSIQSPAQSAVDGAQVCTQTVALLV